MGFFDKFLDAIRLNDDYDDDEFYDEEEDDFDDDYDDYEEEKPKKRFFDKFAKKSSDDDFVDDEDDFEDDEDELDDFEESPRASRKSSSSSSFQNTRQSAAKARRDREREKEREMRERERERERAAKKSRTSNRKKGGQVQMNLNVIRPTSMEDTKDIADILKESRPVVLNLEGIDIDMAQRIIDFTCGVCYALDGDLKIVSNYIYLITPDGVDTYGDVQSILDGSDFEIPSMRSPY